MKTKSSFLTQQAEPLLGNDLTLVSRLLEIVVILWRSAEVALRNNEEAQKFTFAKFGHVIAKYFQAFEVLTRLRRSFQPSVEGLHSEVLFGFQDDQCSVPLTQLASFMPPAAVPTFRCVPPSPFSCFSDSAWSDLPPPSLPPSCGVLSKLRRMEAGATPAQYGQLLDCMCSWGQGGDVLELVSDWLSEALPKQGVSQKVSR